MIAAKNPVQEIPQCCTTIRRLDQRDSYTIFSNSLGRLYLFQNLHLIFIKMYIAAGCGPITLDLLSAIIRQEPIDMPTLPVGQLRSRVGQRRSHIFGQNSEGYDRLPTSFRRLQQLRPAKGKQPL